MSALDKQEGGSHYKDCSIQPVQYIEANNIAFLEGCVIKRCTRHDKPTGKGRQDIEKAIHELQLLLELRYSNGCRSNSSETHEMKVIDDDHFKTLYLQLRSGRPLRIQGMEGEWILTDLNMSTCSAQKVVNIHG